MFLFVLALLPAIIYKKIRRHLWLICEYGNEAQDNGYAFFKYLKNAHKEIDAVYAIRKKSLAYEKVARLGKTVEYGSLKHWVYYLAAEVNISSQKGGKPNAAVCYLLEVVLGVLKNKRVFLQHGVIKDDLPFLHCDKAKVSMFACAAKPEYEFVRDTFGYPAGVVQYVGLCRFDALHGLTSDKNTILVIPTWRMWLERNSNADKLTAFTHSAYYKEWTGLLNDKALWGLLDRYEKRLIFCMHRNMQAYEGLFTSNHSRIHIVNWRDADVSQLLSTAGIMITDFSSVYMDFAYMKKPVLYYQFDRVDFRKNHLSIGYFDYDRDGFGPVCEHKANLIKELEHILKNDCEMPFKYQSKVDGFFTINDNKNCERTFEAIKSLLV